MLIWLGLGAGVASRAQPPAARSTRGLSTEPVSRADNRRELQQSFADLQGHPIFARPDDGSTCASGPTLVALNFTQGFQVYNNLGGVGPEFDQPRVIRYASVAKAESPAMNLGIGDELIAFFCGELLAAEPRARYYEDGTPRRCDPFESVANYQQTAHLASEPHFGAQSAGVAWSGRHADSPPDRRGRILNWGILDGTGRNHVMGEPGYIPNVVGVNSDWRTTAYPNNWTPAMAGPVNWTTGYRQAAGCPYPFKNSLSDNCLERAFGALGGTYSIGQDRENNNPLGQGAPLLTRAQVEQVLTPVSGCGIAGQPSSFSGCPDPTGYYEVIFYSHLEILRAGTDPGVPCPYRNRQLLPVRDRELRSNRFACKPDAALAAAYAPLANSVAGYCVNHPDDGSAIPDSATPLPPLPLSTDPLPELAPRRLPCGNIEYVTSRLDIVFTNQSEYLAYNTAQNRMRGENVQVNVRNRKTDGSPNVLRLRMYNQGSCCMDDQCARFRTMQFKTCPFGTTTCVHADTNAAISCECMVPVSNQNRPTSCPPPRSSMITCPGGTRCNALGVCTSGPESSTQAAAERSALYGCIMQNRSYAFDTVSNARSIWGPIPTLTVLLAVALCRLSGNGATRV